MARILIADDNENLRHALTKALSEREGCVVCGQAVDGTSAVSMAGELKPDLIVLDFAMPGLNGIAAAAEISKILPSTPMVLYTMHLSRQIEREAQRVGIRKVVSKAEPFQSFINGLDEFLNVERPPIGPLGLDADPATLKPGDEALTPHTAEIPAKTDNPSAN
jgi:DNA-binding NarL/FixJ family response regulator